MRKVAESLAAVHTHTHTHGLTNDKTLVVFLYPKTYVKKQSNR